MIFKYPHNNMITWTRLARDLAQMLTTCPLYPSLLCELSEPNNLKHQLMKISPGRICMFSNAVSKRMWHLRSRLSDNIQYCYHYY